MFGVIPLLVLGLFTGGPAVAQTIYTERGTASALSGSNLHCVSVMNPDRHRWAGRACFRPYGDRFFIKDTLADGHHVEVRAQVNVTNDGLRCLPGGGGWRVCNSFARVVPENARIAWTIQLREGSRVITSSALRISDAGG